MTDRFDSTRTAFCSWTGGKDSCLAYHRAREEYDVTQLVHMAVRNTEDAAVDAVDEVLAAQARSLDVPLVRERVTWESYEETYRKTIGTLQPTYGVFGNIAGLELRAWVDDLCEELNRKPVYPLWDENPVELFREFLDEGFKARIVKIDTEQIESDWLGEQIDEEFLEYLLVNDLHPMGEFGEYHTLTVDGPIFETPISVEITGKTPRDGALIAEIQLSD